MAFQKEDHHETKSDREELEQEHRIVERVVADVAVLAEKLHSGREIQATASGEHRKGHSFGGGPAANVPGISPSAGHRRGRADRDPTPACRILSCTYLEGGLLALFPMTGKILSDGELEALSRGSNNTSLNRS
jgi:hypothetical protein